MRATQTMTHEGKYRPGASTITDALALNPIVKCSRCGEDFERDVVSRKLCHECREASGKRRDDPPPEASATTLHGISRWGAADGDDCPQRAAFIDGLLARMKRR